MKKYLLYLICLIFLFTSCNEDESLSGNAYTLTVSSEYDDRFEFIAFITDETGKVLDAGKTRSGKSVTLYAPENYTRQVDFHYASRTTLTSAFNHHINSILHVSPNWETILTVTPQIEQPTQSHTLDVANISADYDIMRHVGPTVINKISPISDSPGSSSLFFTLYESGPITYIIQTVNSGSPRYLHLNEPAQGQNEKVDFTDFIEADGVNLNIGSQATSATAGVIILYPNGKMSDLGTSTINNADDIKLYYYPQNIFPAYITKVSATIDEIEFTYQKYGGRITGMRLLDARISSLDITGNMLTVTTSGSYDQLNVSGNNQWDKDGTYYSVFWNIDMKNPPSKAVILPDVISILKKYWNSLEGASINLESGTISQGTVTNNQGEVLSVTKKID